MGQGANYVINGINAGGPGLAAAAEKQRPISPVQKYMAEVMAGRMSPQEAGVRARLEADGHVGGAPQAPQAPGNGMSLGQAMGMPDQTPTPYPERPMPAGFDARPAAPQGLQAAGSMPMPRNQEEYGQLTQGFGAISQHQRAVHPGQLSLEDRVRLIEEKGRVDKELVETKGKGTDARTTQKLDVVKSEGEANRKSREKIAAGQNAQRAQAVKDRIAQAQKNVDDKLKTTMDPAMKAKLELAKAKIAAIAKMQSSRAMMGAAADTDAKIGAVESELQALESSINQPSAIQLEVPNQSQSPMRMTIDSLLSKQKGK